MLLDRKVKPSQVRSDWAVILDRIPNDFSKRRASEALRTSFSLSEDEAKDLVENTPIILFDRLAFSDAEKLKSLFSAAHVSCTLTDDLLAKRKCFRAVWPEPPNLEFIAKNSSPNFSEESEGLLPASPPQEEIMSGLEEPAQDLSPQMESARFTDREERALKELVRDLQKENESLRAELERIEDSVQERERKRFEPEIERLREMCKELKSGLERAREEGASRGLKLEEAERQAKSRAQSHETELAGVRREVGELKTQLEQFRTEYARAQAALRDARGEIDRHQNERAEVQNLLSDSQKTSSELKRLLGLEQAALSRAQLDVERLEREIKVREPNEMILAQAQKTLTEARHENEDLKRMLSQAQADSVELREETERARIEVEDRFRTQSAELDEWKRKASDWSAAYSKVIKENEFLRSHESEELESLRARNQELTAQLEQAQRQIRDFTAQLAQQEMVQKRMKAASEMAEQEAQLKLLVQKQQALEEEIRAREEEMKKVLTQQETVEREIVKAKQVQQYLLEQAKLKEKNRFQRQRMIGDSGPLFHDSDSDAPKGV